MSLPDILAVDELDDKSFHHSSLPERWTHPEFIHPQDERQARWIQRAWWKDKERTSTTYPDKVPRYIQ
ncbi:uncharacterized protein N7477_008572 [Penicillium maclennaniae]|uniref:uncharacterized protein n=1 Tax=Penicillium maclennaniae TaxID=1343394 RepID=UPI00253F9F6D|nr:uncharacterized protein N7477_008572 [Penicillium maclennaniae]KAJ5666124.1 hypothetical protein N7477_008572 [Penicillium maclennaniae]